MERRNCWNSSFQTVERNNTVFQLLNARMQIILCDNRTFVGTFSAYDKRRNIVLADCNEYKKYKAKRKPAVEIKAMFGTAIIRGENIKSVIVESQPKDITDDSSWGFQDALSSLLPQTQFPVVEPKPECTSKVSTLPPVEPVQGYTPKIFTSTPNSSVDARECMLLSTSLSPIPKLPDKREEDKREIFQFNASVEKNLKPKLKKMKQQVCEKKL